ncbi:Hypothetical protein Pan153_04060 [Gimesia panareensis]|uniref:Uncharacterized protein n=1 Tax=Gimesia panareensis TaxID=2527978 RepID=A0A518FHG2_9PLAN|nr:hypothetical protein [Gimesia panareensis]QDV15787.1 Hypothetical protein Pan153_04060 [Gimesia panareensis]
MGYLIGMDEAGYGPNLGPLVITASLWEVPGDPREFDFWQALESVISNSRPSRNSDLLHVADSKDVHSSAKGLGPLERSTLPFLQVLNGESQVDSLGKLWQLLVASPAHLEEIQQHPWNGDDRFALPTAVEAEAVSDSGKNLKTALEEAGIQLRALCSEIVLPERFNRLCSEYGSKGVMLTRLCMRLLTRVWDRESDAPTLIIGDKHGGRNRYDEFLDEILDGEMIFRVEESTARSVYRVGSTEIRFQTKAEAHFPVAVSSMVCKYTREVMMEQFNQFWSEHVPDIKPTKGYPVDARRFKSEIADAQAQLEIADHLLWRGQ